MGKKAAFGFESKWIRTLVSMATDSSIGLQWGDVVNTLADLLDFAGNKDIHIISKEFEIRPARTKDCGVSCPWSSGKFSIYL